MKKLFIFFTFHFLVLTLYGQSISWQRVYKNPIINGDDEAFDLCAADGSNFYVVGSSASFDPYFYILKVNQYGDTIWTRTFGQYGRAYAVAPSNDGGCVFTGSWYTMFTIKMSSEGDTVWNKSYNGPDGRDIKRTADSGYILCGGDFTGYACKIDTLGDLKWQKYYSTGTALYTIDLALDGGYIAAGQKFDSGSYKSYVVKTDGAGNIVWEKLYNNSYLVKSISKAAHGYVVASLASINDIFRIILLKTDIFGNLLLSDTIPSQSGSRHDELPNIIALNSNKLQISFTREILGKRGSKLITIDSNLNILKELWIPPDTISLLIYSLSKAPGNNADDIIGVGTTELSQLSDEDVYMLRLDSSLSPPPPISIKASSEEVPKEFKLFQNYPNPFNPITEIRYDLPKNSFVSLKIYSALGELVKTLVNNEYKTEGTYAVRFDGKNFASGIYFYSLETKDFKVTKKMVLIK